MKKPLNIGVIGCGDIAAAMHIPTIIANPDTNLAVLCDTDLTRARRLAEKYNVSHFTSSYKELLEDRMLDAVIVATPPWVTPYITMDFLRAGKHVLCEKPMAVDEETAMKVMEIEKDLGTKLQLGFTYRHGKLMETLRKWIRDGRLGSPLVYRLGIFDEIWDPTGNPEHYERIRLTMEHGSPSIHDGAHVADFLYFLADSPVTEVKAFGLKSREEFPATNYDASLIRFANGDIAKVEIGWFFPKFPEGEFEIIGPKGVAVFDRFQMFVKLQTGIQTETVSLDESWGVYCFREQLKKFVASIRNDEPCVPGSIDGINSLRLSKRMEYEIKR